MRAIFQVLKLFLFMGSFQVAAYFVARMLLAVMEVIPPYSFAPKDFNEFWVHSVTSLVAAVLALYSYPADLDYKHKNKD